jgi:hypothetical protein
MDERPKRRWFRFRLSTVLVLTAIVAWGMAQRPFVRWYGWDRSGDHHGWVERTPPSGLPAWRVEDELGYYQRSFPQLRWPALALAVFLAWKAAWAVVERRRRRSATPE